MPFWNWFDAENHGFHVRFGVDGFLVDLGFERGDFFSLGSRLVRNVALHIKRGDRYC